jgi:hypothetical protein
VHSQPFSQLSQQSFSQLQSGQPSQQFLLQQLPPAALGNVAAKDSVLAASALTAANVQNNLVNMRKLTFWLM